MIPVALSTGSVYTYGTARAFELAAAAGYDGVELIVDDRWDTRQPEYLRRLSAAHGIPVLSVHSPFGVASGWPRDEVERVKLALDVAEAVGARTLNLHLPYRRQDLALAAGWRRWGLPLLPASAGHRAYLRWLTDGGLAELQAGTPVSLVVENLPMRRVLGRRFSYYALNTWEGLRRFPRLCLDTTHCGTTGDDLLAVYEGLADRVAHIHLSDYDGKFQHQPLGRGWLPLGPLLQRLEARGYSGTVVVELTPHGLPVQDEAKLAAELRRNLDFCRLHLGQAAPAPVPEAVAGAE
ncbi:MAG TPA: sugar phosphate isomerase/epimerase family protein [Chloroflexota bacterium]|nr:sugar phosphate isomerase/epimerase family protein [Chloroflexota bacterium]